MPVIRLLCRDFPFDGIATNALNALATIAGVKDPEVLSVEGNRVVTIKYEWTRPGQTFDRTDEVLAPYGLKMDVTFDPLQIPPAIGTL